MNYKLIITERADELLDRLVCHLLYKLQSPQAATHLLDGIDRIYSRLEENPFQFGECRDGYLKIRSYREAVLPNMNYLVIFKVNHQNVYVLGIFHGLENYSEKM